MCRRTLARWVGQALSSRARPASVNTAWKPRASLWHGTRSRYRDDSSFEANRVMPLSDMSQETANSLIRIRRPGASERIRSTVYSLSDIRCSRSRSASSARGMTSSTRPNARTTASSGPLSGCGDGDGTADT